MNFFKIFHQKNLTTLTRANTILLVVILFLLVGVVFLPRPAQDIGNKILITAVLFFSIFSLANRNMMIFPAAILLILAQWIAKILQNDLIEIIASLLSTIFFMYIVVKLIRQFVKAKTVTPLVILGSINGYLLIGLIYAIFTIVISWAYPESYISSISGTYLSYKLNFHTYIYYTFITMATVGYGDIVPVTPAARALAVFISVSGQFYIAVLVAFLVGKFAGIHVKALKD